MNVAGGQSAKTTPASPVLSMLAELPQPVRELPLNGFPAGDPEQARAAAAACAAVAGVWTQARGLLDKYRSALAKAWRGMSGSVDGSAACGTGRDGGVDFDVFG